MIASIERLVSRGVIGAFAAEFGDRLARLVSVHADWVAYGAIAVSESTSAGHVCIDLARAHGEITHDWRLDLPDLDTWRIALRASGVVAREGGYAPLVLDDADRLYLLRYWRYEHTLAHEWLARGAEDLDPLPPVERVRAALDRWFPPNVTAPHENEQRRAAAIALCKRFCVIAGGPGTGKTTTAARILAILAELSDTPLRIAMVAPTGKAAARLAQAMHEARAAMGMPETVASEVAGSTIHRLLGPRRGSIRFRHDHGAPLPVDCVLVDEASMIDLALMTKLVRAMPHGARLILLGDQDQISSVEAGAVLASLMEGPRGYRPEFAERIGQLAGVALPVSADASALGDVRARLERSRRFESSSAVGKLARAILEGDAVAIRTDLDLLGPAIIHAHDRGAKALDDVLRQAFAAYVEAVREGGSVREVFDAFNRFRVLCVHRQGASGVVGLNRRIEALLRPLLPAIPTTRRDWYAGRAVMMSRNDYALELYNGDIGIALADPLQQGALRVFFDATAADAKSFAPDRVPDCESAFAITVHKSQGSEFADVLLVLPPDPSPLITRELLYTAVTRAKRSVRVVGDAELLIRGAQSPQSRASGLADKLWGKSLAVRAVEAKA
ncbi:MAG: exodeoxyribonuclease V subunit alpha [Burkholderiales bacterium]